jgi:hypothetical protein
MANMNLGRRLTEGIGGWLMFEYSSGRSGLFSEKYLSQPIGQILTAVSGDRVIAEYQHKPLAQIMKGPGRRPEIDFAVCDPYPDVKIAVESKWIGQTKPPVQSIVWDIIRLEMLSYQYGADCYFILGGKKASLDAYFSSVQFTGSSSPGRKSILRVDINNVHPFDITPSVIHRIKMMKRIFKPYQELKFPSKIRTSRQTPFPENPKSNQFQIIAWKISSMGRKSFFYPKNSFHYVS